MNIEIKLPWRPMTESPARSANVQAMYYLLRNGVPEFHSDQFWVNRDSPMCGDLKIGEGVFFMWAYVSELCMSQVLQMQKHLPIPAPKPLWHIMPESPFDDKKEIADIKITFLNSVYRGGTNEVVGNFLTHGTVSNLAAWQSVKSANKYAIRWAYSKDVAEILYDLLREQENWK